jgi:hypothetical protein
MDALTCSSAAVLAALVAAAGGAAVTAQAHASKREVAEADATRAVLVYSVGVPGDQMRPRIQIERSGRTTFSERVPPHPRGRIYNPRPGGGEHKSVFARDLDGDREPEVFLNVYWGGAHCCWWTRIYTYSPARDTYMPRNHWWGEGRAFYGFRGSLRDLDRDGRPEFSGRDDRFMALSYFAVDPIRIWSYRAGAMYDVTRRHPKQVAGDARELWSFYREARRERWVRELLAAWAADQYLLGRGSLADRVLARAARRGELEGKDAWERPRRGRAWIAVLKRFLRKTGYIRP